MYERFTDRARKVMQLANQEASRLHHEYIGTEHILLGLIKEGNGVAANVLKNMGVELGVIRREIEKVVIHGPGEDQIVMGRLPHTPRARKVIDYSVEETRNLNLNYVGTEHLLLGLLREVEGVAAQVLVNQGLKLEKVREETLALLGKGKTDDEVDAKGYTFDTVGGIVHKTKSAGTVASTGPVVALLTEIRDLLVKIEAKGKRKKKGAA